MILPRLGALLVLAALGPVAHAAVGPPAARGGPPASLHPIHEGAEIPVFRATGVRDATTSATVVHCTNLGRAPQVTFVDVFEFDGSLDCSVGTIVGVNETRTFATRETQLFVEDAICGSAPETEQGSLVISVAAATRLRCTVQILDPLAATPAFLERLSLYSATGIYRGFLVFEGGFETGDTSAWSSTGP
jgi:hypothetical protein